MKNLLYKELKLAVHPLCYVMIGISALYIFLNILPAGMGYILIIASYSILFLGANKGQQSNDLLYTALLPVRKKEIVKARIYVIILMAFVMFAITTLLMFIQKFTGPVMELDETEGMVYLLTESNFFVVNGFSFVILAIADLIYLPLYYRNGKSIILPTLVAAFAYTFLSTTMLILLPQSGLDQLSTVYQLIIFIVCLGAYFGLHYLTYKISSNLLEKVDF